MRVQTYCAKLDPFDLSDVYVYKTTVGKFWPMAMGKYTVKVPAGGKCRLTTPNTNVFREHAK